jgi:hypothetical protein
LKHYVYTERILSEFLSQRKKEMNLINLLNNITTV